LQVAVVEASELTVLHGRAALTAGSLSKCRVLAIYDYFKVPDLRNRLRHDARGNGPGSSSLLGADSSDLAL
jgi:hypothetical protein